MSEPVKARSYDSSRRRTASEQRRDSIVLTARELFLERGYSRTSMGAIAEGAGVALDTVYELVGRKRELFRLLVESAISGQGQAVPAEEREYVQLMHAEPTSIGKLAIYAKVLPVIHERLAPLVAVLQSAASADPELAQLWDEIAERRAANMRRFATELEGTGHLRVTPDEAADVLWATNSPELYLLLVGQRNWTPDRYGTWLAETWQRLLLKPGE